MFCNESFYIMNYEDLKMYKVLASDGGYALLENENSMFDRFIIVYGVKEKKKMRYIWEIEYSFDYLNKQKAFITYCKQIDSFSNNSIVILKHQTQLKKIRNYYVIELSSFFMNKGYKDFDFNVDVLSSAKINGDDHAITSVDNKASVIVTISSKQDNQVVYRYNKAINDISNSKFEIDELLHIIDRKIKNAIILKN